MFRSISPREALSRKSTSLVGLLVATALLSGCGDDDTPTAPDTPAPVAVIETFGTVDEGLTLNPNSARTHDFTVQQTGQVSAALSALTGPGLPEDPLLQTVGLSLGTWNGAACQIIIANDNIRVGQAVTGTANGTGNFCVRIYDVGNLGTSNATYAITVTHF
jgi:hypothetical protein